VQHSKTAKQQPTVKTDKTLQEGFNEFDRVLVVRDPDGNRDNRIFMVGGS
jgi:hypothetical protein